MITSDGNTIKPPVEIKSRSYVHLNPLDRDYFLPMGPAGMSLTWAFTGRQRTLLGLSLTGDRMGTLDSVYYFLNLTVTVPIDAVQSRAVHAAADMLTTVFIAIILSVWFLMLH